MYIEMNRFRKEWTVSVDELKHILCCDDSEFYADFKFFNNRVLKYCHKELTEKTELRYTYTPNKVGRKIRDITFKVETLSDVLKAADYDFKETIFVEFEEEPPRSYSNDFLDFLSDAVNREFTEEEMQVLFDLINTKDLTAYDRDNNAKTAKYNYLHSMYNRFVLYTKKRNIKKRFDYFRRMIQKDQTEDGTGN
jgi:hypothetical protein